MLKQTQASINIRAKLKTWNEHLSGLKIDAELKKILQKDLQVSKNHSELIVVNSKLTVILLFNPTLTCFKQICKDFFAIKSCYRQIIYSGPVLASCGSWILQDSVLSISNFAKILKEIEMPDFEPFYVNAFPIGKWTQENMEKLSSLSIKLNPSEVVESVGTEVDRVVSYEDLLKVVERFIDLDDEDNMKVISAAPSSNKFLDSRFDLCVKSIDNNSIISIGDFKMLIKGDSLCHISMDQLTNLDVLMLARSDLRSFEWLASSIDKNSDKHFKFSMLYSNILNYLSGKTNELVPVADDDNRLKVDPNIFIRALLRSLAESNIPVSSCYSSSTQQQQSITLYHKTGFGTLQLFPISPSLESKEVKDFQKNPTTADQFPGSSCILVWQPFDKKVKPIRFLFSNLIPQASIFEGLSKLKNSIAFSNWDGLSQSQEIIAKAKPSKLQDKQSNGSLSGVKETAKPPVKVRSNAETSSLSSLPAANGTKTITKPKVGTFKSDGIDKNQTLPIAPQKKEFKDKNKANMSVLGTPMPSKIDPTSKGINIKSAVKQNDKVTAETSTKSSTQPKVPSKAATAKATHTITTTTTTNTTGTATASSKISPTASAAKPIPTKQVPSKPAKEAGTAQKHVASDAHTSNKFTSKPPLTKPVETTKSTKITASVPAAKKELDKPKVEASPKMDKKKPAPKTSTAKKDAPGKSAGKVMEEKKVKSVESAQVTKPLNEVAELNSNNLATQEVYNEELITPMSNKSIVESTEIDDVCSKKKEQVVESRVLSVENVNEPRLEEKMPSPENEARFISDKIEKEEKNDELINIEQPVCVIPEDSKLHVNVEANFVDECTLGEEVQVQTSPVYDKLEDLEDAGEALIDTADVDDVVVSVGDVGHCIHADHNAELFENEGLLVNDDNQEELISVGRLNEEEVIKKVQDMNVESLPPVENNDDLPEEHVQRDSQIDDGRFPSEDFDEESDDVNLLPEHQMTDSQPSDHPQPDYDFKNENIAEENELVEQQQKQQQQPLEQLDDGMIKSGLSLTGSESAPNENLYSDNVEEEQMGAIRPDKQVEPFEKGLCEGEVIFKRQPGEKFFDDLEGVPFSGNVEKDDDVLMEDNDKDSLERSCDIIDKVEKPVLNTANFFTDPFEQQDTTHMHDNHVEKQETESLKQQLEMESEPLVADVSTHETDANQFDEHQHENTEVYDMDHQHQQHHKQQPHQQLEQCQQQHQQEDPHHQSHHQPDLHPPAPTSDSFMPEAIHLPPPSTTEFSDSPMNDKHELFDKNLKQTAFSDEKIDKNIACRQGIGDEELQLKLKQEEQNCEKIQNDVDKHADVDEPFNVDKQVDSVDEVSTVDDIQEDGNLVDVQMEAMQDGLLIEHTTENSHTVPQQTGQQAPDHFPVFNQQPLIADPFESDFPKMEMKLGDLFPGDVAGFPPSNDSGGSGDGTLSDDSTRAVKGSVSEIRTEDFSEDVTAGGGGDFVQFCTNQMEKFTNEADPMQEGFSFGMQNNNADMNVNTNNNNSNNMIFYNQNVIGGLTPNYHKETNEDFSEEDQDELETISEHPENEEEDNCDEGHQDLMDKQMDKLFGPLKQEVVSKSSDASPLNNLLVDIVEQAAGPVADVHCTNQKDVEVVDKINVEPDDHSGKIESGDPLNSNISSSSSTKQHLDSFDHEAPVQPSSTDDIIAAWGEPMNLPSPEKPKRLSLKKDHNASHNVAGNNTASDDQVPKLSDTKKTPNIKNTEPTNNKPNNIGHDNKQLNNVKIKNDLNLKKMDSQKALTTPSIVPFFMDVAFIQDKNASHSNLYTVDFFKKVRAKVYIVHGNSVAHLDHLVKAKKLWDDGESTNTTVVFDGVTFINKINAWMELNEEAMRKFNISIEVNGADKKFDGFHLTTTTTTTTFP
ncbi:hypothetical protein HELRODRAFT_179939 [Helobdella robusta]|uniref:Uncharacterized protein n=1 Tax=Helobdella robusta TaxID=6412 RepID=T1FF98_HELRO|nr:hypothetical protein HELRODRAFT_179939 [Helobdella robusta]ESN94847.1 hypothetical protein HELRODRAFT_179939 [Helobdella robusta]